MRAKVIHGNRVIIPAAARRALGLSKGDTVLFELDGNAVRLTSATAALRELQELAAALPGGSWSEELIADRRAEAARE